MAAKDELGRHGERLAEQHLTGRGIRVVDRNWRCPLGEIDLVARDGDDVVFVEVKTRRGVGYGHPLEAITAVKLARLRRLAGAWCAAHPEVRGSVRIDAIGIVAVRGAEPRIEHLQGVYR
ncbi:YraN family protein [Schumannella sp. 10F1B-5-1]|uniref:YraN family protein n=1 Tax=Schumannella sp. 10F1B-5-1 TaxID=2590780 RepID=UPI00113176A3|nr:YraN family protein [Schumannella sp. 10F1B-5-1]TPW72350.1 YraN family protein [Schumannella sp. 10F1B-5-1]